VHDGRAGGRAADTRERRGPSQLVHLVYARCSRQGALCAQCEKSDRDQAGGGGGGGGGEEEGESERVTADVCDRVCKIFENEREREREIERDLRSLTYRYCSFASRCISVGGCSFTVFLRRVTLHDICRRLGACGAFYCYARRLAPFQRRLSRRETKVQKSRTVTLAWSRRMNNSISEQ